MKEMIQKGFEENYGKQKPRCKLVGTDGNVFALIGKVKRSMQKAKIDNNTILEMQNRIMSSSSYIEALNIMGEYVDIH